MISTSITRQSQLTGQYNTRVITLSPEHYSKYRVYGPTFWREYPGLIQDELRYLSADDREFLMTGITPEEWSEAFGDEDYDDEYLEDADEEAPVF